MADTHTNGSINIAGPALESVHPNGARLLSLDGGGVKGISAMAILHAIMEEVKKIEIAENINSSDAPRKPVDYFDLAAGTSTGGLAALMLFRLRMDTEQVMKEYRGLASKIFARKFLGNQMLGDALGGIGAALKTLATAAQFEAEPLEAAVQEVVEKYTDPKDPQRYQLVNKNSGMMFMCSTLEEKGESILLRSYTWPEDAAPVSRQAKQTLEGSEDVSSDGQSGGNRLLLNTIPIVNAARATSAAPLYFPGESWPRTAEDRMFFWDGGLLNNNPIEQLWNTRYDLVKRDEAPPKVACVLSLGCGWSSDPPSTRTDFIGTAQHILGGYLANTEAKHRDFERLVQRMNNRPDQNHNGDPVHIQYWRLNVDLKSKTFDMADYKIMDDLETLTKTYIMTNDVQDKIKQCARELAKGRLK